MNPVRPVWSLLLMMGDQKDEITISPLHENVRKEVNTPTVSQPANASKEDREAQVCTVCGVSLGDGVSRPKRSSKTRRVGQREQDSKPELLVCYSGAR
jgi:hypothetical protein